ncbi:aminoglycoside adenylyltransferase domain-containing protein [Myroides odoratimimus]|uniref:aminoglycoside adenylyltransferase domain-containing protein n=1 Tax=Myroides odoratimimus TaxID=76832 RepID=UPI0003531C14|nr:aminoglycoside adenylyltransferase domain-containing protein [Myroides odoratimimus]EPH13172.1 hypothetical protein HMPREF9713_00907 [Myroides odoratimimus CCUG 12700]MEC4094012.1 aminoglycoside adenylyltransferase domain-containing protein [Myroides odoratimimus]
MNNQSLPLQVTQTTAFLINTLGENLQGIYLYGSYVMGGLQHKSDIDLFVIVNQTLSLERKKILIEQLLVLSGKIDNNQGKRYLEVTIINQSELSSLEFPLYREFQYGEWLREEYTKGYIPETVKDEDLTILLRKIRLNSLTIYGKEATEVIPTISDTVFNKAILSSLPSLIKEIEDDEINVILTLCRMYYSIQTGEVISKDKAVDYLLPIAPDEFKLLLLKAKAVYLGESNNLQNTDVDLLHQFSAFITTLIKTRK